MAKQRKPIDAWSAILFFSLVMIDVILWRGVIKDFSVARIPPRLYFFNVTQGESALLLLPHNIKIMIDAGGDDNIVDQLDATLAMDNNNYIDLAIISYPQLDNYEGYNYILDHYTVGTFLYNGRNDIVDTKEWAAFLEKIHEKHIPLITLAGGDAVTYEGATIDILSPNTDLARSADITDTALVEHIHAGALNALLVSDIGINVESFLDTMSSSLRSDIVTIPFPISGSPAGKYFLYVVDPKIAIVAPGVKTIETSPTKSLMAGLTSSTSALIVRADQNGTVMISPNGMILRVFKEN